MYRMYLLIVRRCVIKDEIINRPNTALQVFLFRICFFSSLHWPGGGILYLNSLLFLFFFSQQRWYWLCDSTGMHDHGANQTDVRREFLWSCSFDPGCPSQHEIEAGRSYC